MGWILLCTHFGVVMTGRRSVKCRIISNEADPDPTITPACNTTVSMPESIRMSPTTFRDSRCGDNLLPVGCSPLR